MPKNNFFSCVVWLISYWRCIYVRLHRKQGIKKSHNHKIFIVSWWKFPEPDLYKLSSIRIQEAQNLMAPDPGQSWNLEQPMGARNRVGIVLSYRSRICKRLWSPGIDAMESIPPAYVAWRAGTSNRVVVPARKAWNRIPGLLKRFKNTGSGGYKGWRNRFLGSKPVFLLGFWPPIDWYKIPLNSVKSDGFIWSKMLVLPKAEKNARSIVVLDKNHKLLVMDVERQDSQKAMQNVVTLKSWPVKGLFAVSAGVYLSEAQNSHREVSCELNQREG